MELKDVLHLYLGCEVEYLTNIGKLFGVHEAYAVMEITGVGMTRIETREYRNLKPILRPLSDMTENEKTKLDKMFDSYSGLNYYNDIIKQDAAKTAYLLSKHFDLFGLIESGQAINKTTL